MGSELGQCLSNWEVTHLELYSDAELQRKIRSSRLLSSPRELTTSPGSWGELAEGFALQQVSLDAPPILPTGGNGAAQIGVKEGAHSLPFWLNLLSNSIMKPSMASLTGLDTPQHTMANSEFCLALRK